MLKIRRPLGRLIFNMGIAIPGKTVFLIETAPCISQDIIWLSTDDIACYFECIIFKNIFVIKSCSISSENVPGDHIDDKSTFNKITDE